MWGNTLTHLVLVTPLGQQCHGDQIEPRTTGEAGSTLLIWTKLAGVDVLWVVVGWISGGGGGT